MKDFSEISLVKNAISNPNEPRHYMTITAMQTLFTAEVGGQSIAASHAVLKVKEVGFGICDPVIYFPRQDVDLNKLTKTEKTTHCPLKGNTEYFDGLVSGNRYSDLAWSYHDTIERADQLKNYIAFDPRQVQVIESTT